ncbi:hypothetical protein SAMN06265365_13432 [Tistlia consotensis]|uniref:N-acetyltransferase domain-containing protein n=1 Tax=Tistlia consotensis USBA 355 TaxID=560819 RepID=A0A1Y6CN19_9PROT|nr:hypothetical protein [Tistlia consotensis]SMF78970.1 hypothetical protein SAMN05428998_13932 [Tistlia consotensis USBA 355]SNS15450.1 hypothetical protein SAMN06265365_13432 [Tistlia consotensis]
MAAGFADHAVHSLQAVMKRSGFTLSVEEDLTGWADFMRSTPGCWPNPTFDPAHCGVDRTNSFWTRIVDGDGRLVAHGASRVFVTGDMMALMENHAIWYGRGALPPRPARNLAGPEVPRMSGVVSYDGGFWAAPEHRGQAFAFVLAHCNRAAALARWQPAWFTGHVTELFLEKGIAKTLYGYPIVERGQGGICLEAVPRPDGCTEANFAVTVIDRAGVEEQCATLCRYFAANPGLDGRRLHEALKNGCGPAWTTPPAERDAA